MLFQPRNIIDFPSFSGVPFLAFIVDPRLHLRRILRLLLHSLGIRASHPSDFFHSQPSARRRIRISFSVSIIMPGINQPITVGTADPEFYAELLRKTTRLANTRLPSIDGPLTLRQILLNAVADISLCQRGNVSATMACLKDNGGTLETQLYVVFNHQDDEAARSCPPHLESIFGMLHQIPCETTAMDDSSEDVPTEVVENFVKIVRAIHNFSFENFAHRVTKHEPKLLYIRKCIEEDQKYLKPKHRSTLVEFLEDVDMIIKMVADARATKQLPIVSIRKLLGIYSNWTECNLLPEDEFADSEATLLDKADRWLAKGV